VDTGRENGFKDPDFLRRLDAVQKFVLQFEHDGLRAKKTLALTDVVKETHRALNENRDAFYAIPAERRLVSQELLLFENAGSDDVEDFVDSQFSSGRVTVRIPMVDGARYNPYLEALLPELERILGPDVQITSTGLIRLLGNTVTAALQTMIRSYISAFIVITVLMIALIGRLRMGLVSMIPNLSPIVVALGLMGWLGIPLDMFTLLIGTIAIGLAVDDTIHFMHNFRRYFEQTGDPHLAVQRTLQSAGQAMLFTTLVLVSGFLVYTQAYMNNLFAFGTLTATAIAVAFVADVTLAPALVTALSRRGGAKLRADP
jgi:predicted RND superfamily exporter protein